MIAYILQVSICLAFFYAFYHFALRKETLFQGNRFYLLITLLLSFLLPLIRISVEAWSADTKVLHAPVYVGAYLQNFENMAVRPEAWHFSWLQFIQFLYWSGVIMMGARFLLALRAIVHLKSSSQKINIENTTCVTSLNINTPFSFWNSIFIPANHQYTAVEIKEVICHEHAHLSGRHSLDILLIEVTSVLLWFNPFIYFYKNALKEIHEFVADAAVIKNNAWEPYAKFLIAQQYTGLQSRLSNQLIYSQLKNRLIMMTQKPSSWIAKWKYTGVLPLLLLALLLFSFRSKERSTPFLDKASSSSDISLGAANIAPGSVHVTVGGHLLKEKEDYIIDNNIGRLKIINPAYLQPNIPINVSFKDNAPSKIGLDDNTEQPIFPGCEKLNLMEQADCSHKKLFEYVADHLKYPEDLKAAKIEGKVYVSFVITNNGYVSEARVTKSLYPSADKAALDVVNSMNDNVGKWTPGTKEGIPVTMDMMLPISFVLGTEKNAEEATVLEMDQKSEEPYAYVERMPQYPDGQEAMYNFLYDNIHYPEEAKKDSISGTVIVQFVVSKEGEIQNAKVLRGIGGGCNEEALRVVNRMPNWSPGMHNGRNVPVVFTLPIKFIL